MPRLLSLCFPLCLFSLLPFSPTASAQVSIYGTGAITSYGLKPVNSSRFSLKSGTPGFVVGGFYNLPLESRFTVGVDLRLAQSPGARGGTAGALALRFAFVPYKVPLRPYLQIGPGVIRTSTNAELVNDQVRAGTYTSGAAIFAFGLDIPITHSIDLRALDVGSEAGGSVGTVYADTGIVVHFGHQ
jgi:hypothetical protein